MCAARTPVAVIRPLTIALVALMVVGGASSSEMSASQQPDQPPVFRSGVQVMAVDAVATDAQGRPVMDLTKEEFGLFDEGERQDIAFFATVLLPIQAPRPPVLRDVASNAFAEDGRLFVLILDDIHSYRVTTPVIKAAARRLVERLSPQDLVAVLWMSTDKGGPSSSRRTTVLSWPPSTTPSPGRQGWRLWQVVRMTPTHFRGSLKACAPSTWWLTSATPSRGFRDAARPSCM